MTRICGLGRPSFCSPPGVLATHCFRQFRAAFFSTRPVTDACSSQDNRSRCHCGWCNHRTLTPLRLNRRRTVSQTSQPGPGAGWARRSATRLPGARAPGSRAGRIVRGAHRPPVPVPSILDNGGIAALGDNMIARCEPRDLGSHHEGTIVRDRRDKTGYASRAIGLDND